MNNFNQNNQGQPQQFPQYPQGYNMPPKKKKLKKWQIALIVIGVLAVVGAAGGSEDTTAPSTSVKTSATESTDKKEDTDTTSTNKDDKDDNSNDDNSSSEAKGENSSSAEDNIFNVGEVLETKNLKISYQRAEDFTNFDEYFPPADGKRIVRAYFVIENVGSTDQFVSFYDFDCYADGSSAEEYIWNEDDILNTVTISPGRKTEGYVYYEVPINAESIELEYETSFWTSEKAIFIVK